MALARALSVAGAVILHLGILPRPARPCLEVRSQLGPVASLPPSFLLWSRSRKLNHIEVLKANSAILRLVRGEGERANARTRRRNQARQKRAKQQHDARSSDENEQLL